MAKDYTPFIFMDLVASGSALKAAADAAREAAKETAEQQVAEERLRELRHAWFEGGAARRSRVVDLAYSLVGGTLPLSPLSMLLSRGHHDPEKIRPLVVRRRALPPPASYGFIHEPEPGALADRAHYYWLHSEDVAADEHDEHGEDADPESADPSGAALFVQIERQFDMALKELRRAHDDMDRIDRVLLQRDVREGAQ